jgi:hypothetical protein
MKILFVANAPSCRTVWLHEAALAANRVLVF